MNKDQGSQALPLRHVKELQQYLSSAEQFGRSSALEVSSAICSDNLLAAFMWLSTLFIHVFRLQRKRTAAGIPVLSHLE